MISIDTNILVRSIVEDDAQQAEAAQSFLQALTPENRGFICREVVLETAWVLYRTYRFSREQVSVELLAFTTRDNFVVETGDDVARSARRFGEGNDDFSDLMILEASRRMGALPLYTFDRRLSRLDGAILVGA